MHLRDASIDLGLAPGDHPRIKEVRSRSGLSRATVYRLENEGRWPRRYRLTRYVEQARAPASRGGAQMNVQQAPQHLPEKSNSPDSEVATCLLTTKQAAQYLCLEPQTLEVWRERGKGPAFVKIGALVRYERQELDAFIKRNRRRNTSDRPLTHP